MTYLFESGKLLEQERKHGLCAGLGQVLHEEDLVWRREAIRARRCSTALIVVVGVREHVLGEGEERRMGSWKWYSPVSRASLVPCLSSGAGLRA